MLLYIDSIDLGAQTRPPPSGHHRPACSDLCGFTELSAQLAPDIVFTLLHTMFGILDRLTDHFNVFKYETGACRAMRVVA